MNERFIVAAAASLACVAAAPAAAAITPAKRQPLAENRKTRYRVTTGGSDSLRRILNRAKRFG